MTRHYFNSRHGGYGAILLVRPRYDLDALTTGVEGVVRRHESDTLLISGDTTRIWSGKVIFERGPAVNYAFTERKDRNNPPVLYTEMLLRSDPPGSSTPDIVDQLLEISDEEHLPGIVDQLLDIFRLEELPPQRETYQYLIDQL